jgi:hypothetical protein
VAVPTEGRTDRDEGRILVSLKARFTRPLVTGLAAGAIALLAPTAAQAGPLVASAPDCAEESLSQPFLPWADPASYQFAPDGGFEAGGSGWTLSGGAATVAGNESFYVHDAGDTQSLRLPAGSSATSPTVCVGIEHPTIRVFARNAGSPFSSVSAEVLFETASGQVLSAPIGVIAGGASWQPSAPMPIVANLLALLPGEHTPVAFRFTAHGGGGSWKLDDLYVDPYRRG